MKYQSSSERDTLLGYVRRGWAERPWFCRIRWLLVLLTLQRIFGILLQDVSDKLMPPYIAH